MILICCIVLIEHVIKGDGMCMNFVCRRNLSAVKENLSLLCPRKYTIE